MNNEVLITKSFDILIEMLTDRGMDLTNVNKTVLCNSLITNSFINTTFKIQIENIIVVYYLAPKFRWLDLKKTIEESINESHSHILIVNDKISLNNMKSINSTGINFQIIHIKELQFNISKSFLVPKHEKVDEMHVKTILDTFQLRNKSQLPTILKNDPMSRYMGLKFGDVIKVTRFSPSSGEYFVYRCCV